MQMSIDTETNKNQTLKHGKAAPAVPREYEKQIQKLEGDVRIHIRVEQ